jgi:putative acetyltransferase
MIIRNATLEDLPEMKQLYVDTIRTVCNKDYNEEQVNKWSSSVNKEERWLDMIVNQFVLIAESDELIAGFGTLKDHHYIDLFYVHKDFQGQGVARELLRRLQAEAIIHGEKLLTSDISITARPFFEKQGFKVVVEQENVRQDVILINYKMFKRLPGAENKPEFKGIFNITDTFKITGRGLIFAGTIVEGDVGGAGDYIEFRVDNILRVHKIRSREMIRYIEYNPLKAGLLIQCKDKEEIDDLRAWRPFNVIAKIYDAKANVL